jgi:hypothetical protein
LASLFVELLDDQLHEDMRIWLAIAKAQSAFVDGARSKASILYAWH